MIIIECLLWLTIFQTSYGTSAISKAVLQQLNENFVAQLLSWKEKLPPALQIDLHDHTSPYLPHVLILQ